jgi:hypothetical protein
VTPTVQAVRLAGGHASARRRGDGAVGVPA